MAGAAVVVGGGVYYYYFRDASKSSSNKKGHHTPATGAPSHAQASSQLMAAEKLAARSGGISGMGGGNAASTHAQEVLGEVAEAVKAESHDAALAHIDAVKAEVAETGVGGTRNQDKAVLTKAGGRQEAHPWRSLITGE